MDFSKAYPTRYRRPWVRINGRRSDSVRGLVIVSLPPISKPAMRYTSEEIDGRDGDIVTRLGYQAYDKELAIGLHGDYDIDRVIEYFAGSGEVVFSSEPDKVYRFEQLEAVDFERLVRYRTATVKIHVQPFKTSLLCQPKSFDGASGVAIVENTGNVEAAPTITVEANGKTVLVLDGSPVLTIDRQGDYTAVIDVRALEAATPEGVLLNRDITGDYQRLTLSRGRHTLEWSGSVKAVTVADYSRWI